MSDNSTISPQPVFRFAPSPNGALHLGHALSALASHDMAHARRARFLLRIEDIDIGRCRPEFEVQILADLAWLGLTWEEPVRRQSEHFATYEQHIEKLKAQKLLYPCFASRREIAEAVTLKGVPHPLDPDGAPVYPGLCKKLTTEEIAARKEHGIPYALRLDMEKALQAVHEKTGRTTLTFTEIDSQGATGRVTCNPARWGDAVIARKDVPTSYHLSVIVDDAYQGITHVTRGRDLYAATDLHRLLQILLGLPEPVYHHHALLLDGAGKKLSKSEGAPSIASLRAQGMNPDEIRALAFEKLN